MIEQIIDTMENLKELDFKSITKEQKQKIRDNYNLFVSNFEYAVNDFDNFVLICSSDTFNSLEYYIGLEYERDSIEYKFLIDDKILVSYYMTDRIERFINHLE